MAPFSISCAATVACAAYAVMAFVNLYRLMNPLWMVDLDALYPKDRSPYVRPLWSSSESGEEKDERLGVRIYLSHLPEFSLDFLDHDRDGEEGEEGNGGGGGGSAPSSAVRSRKAVLLWEDPSVPSPTSSRRRNETHEGGAEKSDHEPLTKSFVITTRENMERNNGTCSISDMVWKDDASDGRSVSFILAAFDYVRDKLKSLGLGAGGRKGGGGEDGATAGRSSSSGGEGHGPPRKVVHVDEGGPIWRALMNNRTVHVHVIVTRGGATTTGEDDEDPEGKKRRLATLSRTNRLLLGAVPMIKHDEPIPRRPTRILPMDVVYLLRKYVTGSVPMDEPAPWDNPSTSSSASVDRVDPARLRDHENYHRALRDKRAGVTYSYWKPEVAVRLVPETTVLPYQVAVQSGLHVVKTSRNTYGYLPPLHADEIGLTSDKYIPLNETVTDLPLRITLDAMSAQRYRLLSHMSNSLESQRALGFEQSDIDDVRRLISDTNVTLLAVTCLASVLHLLFEFLTFKSEVEFWRGNKDLTGLSVRALFVDVACQSVVLAYLVEMDSSLLMTVPAAIGIMIAAWKCQKACKFRLVRSSGSRWSLFGWTVEASRLRKKRTETSDDGGAEKPDKNGKGGDSKNKRKGNDGGKNDNVKKTTGATKDGDDGGGADGGTTVWRKDELDVISLEMDRRAFRTVGKILFPLVAIFALRSLFVEEHSGWYSWLITSASGSVYALGFVLMTPQLFLNYKLKSVAHLPWKVLCYKFLNTFIDDLFAFIIRMPTMARISCFRDDVVFIVYLFQRWTYPVDESRPVEGRGGGGGNAT